MAISQVVAGAYSSSYSGSSLNYTRRGFNLSFIGHGEEINESDIYAKTLLDLLYAGLDIDIECICRVYSSAVLAAFWPWGATIGTISTTLAPIARLGTSVASPFVLTATANTPAANSPATATANYAILSQGFNRSLIFSSTARDVPIRFSCLASESGGTAVKLLLS